MKTNIKDILATKTKQALSSNILQADNIKKNIVIIDELRSLIPPLSSEEYAQLETNILTHGCQTPLQLWQTPKQSLGITASNSDEIAYVLIDGHNRFKVCSAHNLPFEIYQLSFDSIKEAKDYMINLQLGRRNLSPTQIAYFRGLRYNNEKANKTENLSKGQNVLSGKNEEDFVNVPPKGQNVPSKLSTAERLAEEYKVNPKTIKRDAEFAKGLEKLESSLRNQILDGTIKIDKSAIQEIGKNYHSDNLIGDIAEIENLTLTNSHTKEVIPIKEKLDEISALLKKFSKTQKKSDLEELIKTAKETLKILK
ncbi:hypothetical protein Emtol_0029 (plasmid) [Emticicia oligotrophica DSM 17448]|uniref:ParB/Sulfiredoxin domain-containing protein n=1 Tax=Emticicia oligotrophica (strain DSM 17448 / CIP 109782 / MTCC 6937 / GPTSA100-15) TaxID=929562 RepID=A0ABN4ATK1_EMTOG|nr:hypothetical protein [Emticicia oligotrophica]AFK05715.1 hypothetical protein Emtol_0029 [Emticicia oligotrophica DSM 17448]